MAPCDPGPGVDVARPSPGRTLIDLDELRRQLAALLPELRGYARFLVRNVTEADDLVQEALLRGLAGLPALQQGTSLRPWMFTILRNTFYEQARRRRSERTALLDGAAAVGEAAPEQPGPPPPRRSGARAVRVAAALREALVLVGAQGFSYEEAAAICGVPAGTVKARVSRARARLVLTIGGSGPAEA